MKDEINFSHRPSREGANNPMWGRKHSDEARRKQSEAAKKRHQQFQQWKNSQKPLTMDEFLSNNPSVKEYITLLANKIIKEQIDKVVWKKQNQRIRIPNP